MRVRASPASQGPVLGTFLAALWSQALAWLSHDTPPSGLAGERSAHATGAVGQPGRHERVPEKATPLKASSIEHCPGAEVGRQRVVDDDRRRRTGVAWLLIVLQYRLAYVSIPR